jgi:phosphoserine phosphatase
MKDGVLTLIAAENAGRALDAAARDVAAALTQAGARIAGTDVLADGIACDIAFSALDPAAAAAAARSALGGRAIDAVAQCSAGRKKRLLVADLESTIIENEMLEELASFLGLREKVAAITRRAMNGEIDFAAAVRERVGLLKGLDARVLEEAGARIRITPGARALVATMKANGAKCALVTGGFGVYADRICAELGFDVQFANEIEVKDGRLTGGVIEPVLGREAKLETLERLAAELGIPLDAALAVGDGANDLPMIAAAGLGVAFHGKPAVAAAAPQRIDHADLSALLYVQGYPDAEIVGGAQP